MYSFFEQTDELVKILKKGAFGLGLRDSTPEWDFDLPGDVPELG